MSGGDAGDCDLLRGPLVRKPVATTPTAGQGGGAGGKRTCWVSPCMCPPRGGCAYASVQPPTQASWPLSLRRPQSGIRPSPSIQTSSQSTLACLRREQREWYEADHMRERPEKATTAHPNIPPERNREAVCPSCPTDLPTYDVVQFMRQPAPCSRTAVTSCVGRRQAPNTGGGSRNHHAHTRT